MAKTDGLILGGAVCISSVVDKLRQGRIVEIVPLRRNAVVYAAGQEYLSDGEYAQLQQKLMADPRIGDVIPGSGGVRKMRWRVAGRGKRGGVRVIYFLRLTQGQIWLLTLYAKNITDTIPAHVLKRIKDEIDG